MKKLIWGLVAVIGSCAIAALALHRGESINAMWIVVAAACIYALGYRFYSAWIAARVLSLDASRATPAVRLNNGRDYVPTHRWVVFGHHFAAIAGPGPLIGPTLAAQFGYLPGTLWILIGAVLGGCVQDMTVLFISTRRNGRSLGQMARDELGPIGGYAAMIGTLMIMIILIAVLGLVVVNAMKHSPWSTATVVATLPIAILIGIYMRDLRPGRVLEASLIGVALLMLAVFGGRLFPFVFITIACGAISGFHALIASGTTPKLIATEADIRLVGYGSMMLESGVALMAMIAAALLEPGVYFAINSPAGVVGAAAETAVATISSWGFPVTVEQMHSLARDMGESTLFARTGGAPSLAVGMASVFASTFGRGLLAIWYHFAIMFEAVFILTTLDAGTRVGRFMLQDLLGHVWRPLGETSWYPSVLLSSALIVAGWGYFLYIGVVDPNGGVNILWPLFGIANQLLAAIALCVVTGILVKQGKQRHAWVTGAPLAWLAIVTTTAVWEKVVSHDVRVGFLAAADQLAGKLAAGSLTAEMAAVAPKLIFNQRLDAALAVLFTAILWIVIADTLRVCWRVSRGLAVLPSSETCSATALRRQLGA